MDPHNIEELFNVIISDDNEQVCAAISTVFDVNDSIQSLPPHRKVFGKLPMPILNLAASFGSVQCVTALIEAGAVIDSLDGNNNTPLIAAAYSGNAEIVQILLDSGSDAEHVDKSGFSAFHIAAEFGKNEVMSLLMSRITIDVNMKTNSSITPLMLAAKYNHPETVDYLLSLSANTSIVDINSNTAVHYALQNKALECAGLMLEKTRFPINTPNFNLRTVLHEAAIVGDVDIFILILEKGGNPKALDSKKNSILHLAAISKNPALVEFILYNNFVDPTLLNSQGYAALHNAAKYGPVESFNMLLNVSSAVLNEASSGYAPIHLAIEHHHLDIVAAILEHTDFDPSTVNKAFMTPLHIASRIPNVELLECLIKSSYFDVSIPDSIGWSPIHYAASKGSLECVKLLIENGADPTNETYDGETAFDILERRGSKNIYQYLESLKN